MKVQIKKIILISLILFSSTPILKSQVTIGSYSNPVSGALLDLKTKDADTENVTVDANKGGGLILPRVKLVNINTLQPFINPTDADVAEQKKLHTGMMVYNLETSFGFSQGIYVWNGAQWEPSRTPPPVTPNNGLTSLDTDFQLGGTLAGDTEMDLGQQTLTFTGGGVNDKIYMIGVKDNIPNLSTNSVSPLGINTNGELFAMKASNQGNEAKAFNYVVYKLTGDGDWIQNFNTNIPASKYTLVIVGSFFKPAVAYGAINRYNNGTAIAGVIADRYEYNYSNEPINGEKASWYIHADYLGAAPTSGGHGTWTIHCMVINHSLLDNHPGNPFVCFGPPTDKKNITADSAPAGLQ
jgi:hypothetical protein